MRPVSSQLNESAFFVVTPVRFVCLTFLTAGLYVLFWLYKNWAVLAARSGQKISPSWRTIFIYVTFVNFAQRVRTINEAAADKVPPKYHQLYFIGLMTVFVFLQILSVCFEEGVILSLLSFLPLLPINSYFVRYNQAIIGSASWHTKVTGLEWMLIGVGLILYFINFYVLPYILEPLSEEMALQNF